MPARPRLAALAAPLLLFAAALPVGARAATADRVAQFAQRYKALQQHILFETEDEQRAKGGERLRPASDSLELSGPGMAVPGGRSMLPLRALALSTNVRANDPSGDVAGATQSEVSVATLGDNVLLAFNDGGHLPGNTQGYAWSVNGGQSFTDGGAPPTLPTWQWDSDPLVAVSEASGDFWYLGLNSASGVNGIGIDRGRFVNGALTWTATNLVRSTPNDAVLLDKPWMAVDPASGRIYVAYTAFSCPFCFPGDTIDFQYSSDGGATWSDPQPLSSPSDAGYVQGARVGVGPGGEVYVTWYVIGRSAPYKDYYPVRKSTNGGVSFGPPVVAASAYVNFSSGAPGFNRPRGIPFPTLAVDRSGGPHRGRVYIGWQESVNYYADEIGTGNDVIETEPNDTPAGANAFVLGDSLRGTLTPGDIDFYKFTGTKGQTVVAFSLVQSASLDMSMRILCGDGNSQLALSDNGPGQSDLLVFTLPADGTYYVRLKDISGSGTYTVYTGTHTLQADDRARDHRDVFVSSSDNALTWSAPVRINDDPAWLDDWLPELAVANLSEVYASWYDWRDASSALCNAASQVYLSHSTDGGTTWTTLGSLSDAPSNWTDWTNAKSNLQPNQGDYNALFADCQAVFGAWSDARDADVNIYTARYPPLSSPTLVTFASAAATPHQVTVVWQVQGSQPLTGTIQRRDAGTTAWSPLGSVSSDANGRMSYVDPAVSPGAAYEYQLVIPVGGSGTWVTCAASVDVPVEMHVLAFSTPYPNPTQSDIIVSFDLPTSAPADIQLIDTAGRKVFSMEVGSLGPGRQTLNLGPFVHVKSGIYFLHLAQAGQETTARIAIIR